jgi:hypothetical protein
MEAKLCEIMGGKVVAVKFTKQIFTETQQLANGRTIHLDEDKVYIPRVVVWYHNARPGILRRLSETP